MATGGESSADISMNLNVLLLGKTGEGKSATGNSLLGRMSFSAAGNFTSETVLSRKDVTRLNDGRRLHVVDTPGVGDTGLTEQAGKRIFARAITEAITMCLYGYDSLLLVIRYGTRMTHRDRNVIAFIKRVFGGDFLRRYGILIVTFGDIYLASGGTDRTFPEWCQRQRGVFRDLHDEVNGRVLLFNNNGTTEVKDAKRNELVDMVLQLNLQSGRYTNDMFHEARRDIEKLDREKVYVRNDLLDETSFILALLDKIANRDRWTFSDDLLFNLQQVEQMISSLKERVQQEGREIPREARWRTQDILRRAKDRVGRALRYYTAAEQRDLSLVVADQWLDQINGDVQVMVQEFQDLKDNVLSVSWLQRILDYFTRSTIERSIFGRIDG